MNTCAAHMMTSYIMMMSHHMMTSDDIQSYGCLLKSYAGLKQIRVAPSYSMCGGCNLWSRLAFQIANLKRTCVIKNTINKELLKHFKAS